MKLKRQYNKLETEHEVLKEYVKNNCFNKLIEKIGEPEENKRLKDENKRLRLKIKDLKLEILHLEHKK